VIFIDTGAFLARFSERDQHHEEAMPFWRQLAARRERLFTSNLVLSEALTLAARRLGHRFAAEAARRTYALAAFTILRPEREEELQAVGLLDQYADQTNLGASAPDIRVDVVTPEFVRSGMEEVSTVVLKDIQVEPLQP